MSWGFQFLTTAVKNGKELMYNRARLQENGWFTVQCGKPFMICHDLSRKWRASKPVKCRQGLYPTPERLDAVSKFLRTLQNVDVKASGITEVRPSRKHWHYKPHGKPRLIDECSTVLRESLKCCDSTMLWTGVLGIKLILALKKNASLPECCQVSMSYLEKLASCTECSTHQLFLSRLS